MSTKTTGCLAFIIWALIAPFVWTILGAFSGWVVGWAFGEPILNILGQLGVHNVSMLQFGLFLGFIGGFIPSARKAA